jgi:inositol 1,4,5-triphosphate receptor type 1/inositol 1,4,5-triphosphate receptor type 3
LSKNGFETHIKEDHYMWNYLFFIAYLLEKDTQELNGIEGYVKN